MIENPAPQKAGTYRFHRSAQQILPEIRDRLNERGLPEDLAVSVAAIADAAGLLSVDRAIDVLVPLLRQDIRDAMTS